MASYPVYQLKDDGTINQTPSSIYINTDDYVYTQLDELQNLHIQYTEDQYPYIKIQNNDGTYYCFINKNVYLDEIDNINIHNSALLFNKYNAYQWDNGQQTITLLDYTADLDPSHSNISNTHNTTYINYVYSDLNNQYQWHDLKKYEIPLYGINNKSIYSIGQHVKQFNDNSQFDNKYQIVENFSPSVVRKSSHFGYNLRPVPLIRDWSDSQHTIQRINNFLQIDNMLYEINADDICVIALEKTKNITCPHTTISSPDTCRIEYESWTKTEQQQNKAYSEADLINFIIAQTNMNINNHNSVNDLTYFITQQNFQTTLINSNTIPDELHNQYIDFIKTLLTKKTTPKYQVSSYQNIGKSQFINKVTWTQNPYYYTAQYTISQTTEWQLYIELQYFDWNDTYQRSSLIMPEIQMGTNQITYTYPTSNNWCIKGSNTQYGQPSFGKPLTQVSSTVNSSFITQTNANIPLTTCQIISKDTISTAYHSRLENIPLLQDGNLYHNMTPLTITQYINITYPEQSIDTIGCFKSVLLLTHNSNNIKSINCIGTWKINDNITADAGYGQFNISKQDSSTGIPFILLIGYNTQHEPESNAVTYIINQGSFVDAKGKTITITTDGDYTNALLYNWLIQNATKVTS